MSNVRQLPDAYTKRLYHGEKSNHAKMLELNEIMRDEYKQSLSTILDALDLSTATGKNLDLLGETVNQKRGGLNDKQYLVMIYMKIARNFSKGDYNSIMRLLVFLLGCKNGDIEITDIGNAKVAIKNLNLTIALSAGFNADQILQLIEELLPCGVGIGEATLEGTFQFADGDTEELDENKGFGNVEQTIGGYFGYFGSNTDNPELPI